MGQITESNTGNFGYGSYSDSLFDSKGRFSWSSCPQSNQDIADIEGLRDYISCKWTLTEGNDKDFV